MAKQSQSRSKSAYRGFVGYTAKMIQFYEGASASSDDDIANILAEARIEIEQTEVEMFDGVLFSRTRDLDRWKDDFRNRTAATLDKIRESLEEQLAKKLSDSEAEFRKEAAFYGASPDDFAEFLLWSKPIIKTSDSFFGERKTSYTSLRDVLNVYTKIAFAVVHVRYDGKFYHLLVEGSDGRRTAHRRKSRQKKSKKTLRF